MAARPYVCAHLLRGTCAPPKGHCDDLEGLILPAGNVKTWGGLEKSIKLVLQGEMSIKQHVKDVPNTSSEIRVLYFFLAP